MENNTNTPETDAATHDFSWGDWVTADFARKLERERDEARAELEEYRSIAENIGATKAVSDRDKAVAERDDAREKYTTLLTENMLEVHSLHKQIDNAVAVADELAEIASLCLGQTLSSIKSNTDENNLKQADKITRALEQWKKLKKL
jgi:hypothetical protein